MKTQVPSQTVKMSVKKPQVGKTANKIESSMDKQSDQRAGFVKTAMKPPVKTRASGPQMMHLQFKQSEKPKDDSQSQEISGNSEKIAVVGKIKARKNSLADNRSVSRKLSVVPQSPSGPQSGKKPTFSECLELPY